MRTYRIALAWQVALAAYMQLVSWVPLGHWNYQPCCATGLEQLQRGTLSAIDAVGAAAFVLPLASFWWGTRTGRRWAMWLSLVAVAIWLGLQLWSWWIPYIVGASDRWASVYARTFSQSTRVLPRWGNHLPPDGLHVVLQILLLGTLVTGTRGLLRE
jgi:hypothetical protein